MWRSFASSPDPSPYTALIPNVPLDERNALGAPGQDRSESWDFTHEDAAPDIEFNEIVWQSVRGPRSPMPPPIRAPVTAWAQYHLSRTPLNLGSAQESAYAESVGDRWQLVSWSSESAPGARSVSANG